MNNKNTKKENESKTGQDVKSTTNPSTTGQIVKLAVFEEDDYFEEFDDEEFGESGVKDDIDFKQWQEDWEDEEINDNFEKVLRKEMENFKSGNNVK